MSSTRYQSTHVKGRYASTCERIAESSAFQGFIYAVILANAVVIGLGTYPSLEAHAGDLLNLLNEVFLGVFIVELAIRIGAHGSRPQDFFRDGWNVFDFVIIAVALVPWLRKSATLLRLVRLLRVLRLASVRDDLKTIAVGMYNSIPAIASLLVMVTLVVYFYAMIGWVLFHKEDPEHWGTIGKSMLTLFTVSTLEGWNVVLDKGEEIQPGAWVFFVSFVLLISFLVIQIVFGILMYSIESAAEEEKAEEEKLEARLRALARTVRALERESRSEENGGNRERLEELRRAVDELEEEMDKEAAAGRAKGRRRLLTPRGRGMRGL